ncbi:helix-turn-helix domain-containing protein [Mumia sp. ZJ1417]|uniref:helix-turn-helix domain-containing protein n=1 Tax=Mumia sp. ZJ1417 TaxID=2708082 RepID=UPI001AB0355D|nr:helix-turn-helix domain-containing protein [Mumia sp. ZJ1417]
MVVLVEIVVSEAAERLGVGPSRVRQLLNAGDLQGRRAGRDWLVSADDVARLQGQRRRPGRPLGPLRAWGLLDLLEGGAAPWLSYSARSQVRSSMSRLRDVGADHWRSMLRGRSRVVRVVAHPAAIPRLLARPEVHAAGAVEAVRRGFDLVALESQRDEVYVPSEEWPALKKSLTLRDAGPGEEASLVVRMPERVWPFDSPGGVSDAALAADLLEAAEPRAVSAGDRRLSELLREWQSK